MIINEWVWWVLIGLGVLVFIAAQFKDIQQRDRAFEIYKKLPLNKRREIYLAKYG